MTQHAARGACYCGRVRFEAELPPRFVCHCHCENCRRAHGAAFVTWAGFRTDQVRMTAGADELRRYRTETDALRTFCGTCGSPMGFEADHYAGGMHLYAATLEDPRNFEPTFHVNYQSKLPWLQIDDDLPKYEGTLLHAPVDLRDYE